jgi:CBS domain-containing protein/anti-sigma regulatory factor (Ser/Thr protein kinase)
VSVGDPGSNSKIEFTRVHELVYELRIAQVMSDKVLTLRPDDTLRDAKEVLRLNRISGAPVAGEDQRLAGIVSVEDIIVALEKGEMDQPLAERMTRQVVSVRADETVVKAVNIFAQSRLGRLPVVDDHDRLVGIITRGDIVRGLLKAIDLDYRQVETARPRASHVFDDLDSDRTSVILRYSIPAGDVKSGGAASSQIKRALSRLGVNPRAARCAAIASYEAEMNIIIHATSGGEMVVEVQPGQIVVQAIDSGPGIPDLEQAMQPGFSTAPDWVRELGFGAGMGLCNIKACADQLRVDTGAGRGTHLHILVRLEGH